MCKASIYAESFRDAKEGESLGIYTGYLGLGTFNADGEAAGKCAICCQTGARMTLADIPPKLREMFGLGASESVIFLETEGSHTHVVHDLFYFEDRPSLGQLPVALFADVGISVTVTFVPASDVSVEDVIGRPADEVAAGESLAEMLERYSEAKAA